jgi:hypothetical protein
MKNSRLILGITLMGVAACATLEAGLRLSGAVDFPLYEVKSDLGYIPTPNQYGSFLKKNDWAFNELSMGVDYPYNPSVRPATFLIGDSVVQGGNLFRQSDRLGPQLQMISCSHIWPISAGGWAFLNELRYLRIHQSLFPNIDRIIFVLNSGDFVTGSVWKSELDHPTYRPWLASLYVLRKYVLPSASTEEPPPETDEWRSELSWLVSAFPKPIVIALYPDPFELKDATLRASQLDFRQGEIAAVSAAIKIINIADDSRYGPSLYRDDIHPTSNGNTVLAKILSDAIDECKTRNDTIAK